MTPLTPPQRTLLIFVLNCVHQCRPSLPGHGALPEAWCLCQPCCCFHRPPCWRCHCGIACGYLAAVFNRDKGGSTCRVGAACSRATGCAGQDIPSWYALIVTTALKALPAQAALSPRPFSRFQPDLAQADTDFLMLPCGLSTRCWYR